MTYERNYRKLERLGIIRFLEEKHDYAKLKNEPFMDLNLDRLYTNKDYVEFAMAHNYVQNGDVIADPDMQIRVYPLLKAAEAVTYQDCFGYRQVYYENDTKVDTRAKRDLNTFLGKWLTNLINQGFKFAPEQPSLITTPAG